MRLIDADELKERAYEMILEDPDAFNGGWSVNAVTVEDIDESPTIEAAPVVHGEWERTKFTGEYLCSNCQSVEYARRGKKGESLWDFCPNCGAKMDRKAV